MAPQESEREEDKRANRLDKKKRRAAASEIMEALRDEFGVTPEVTYVLTVFLS